MLENITAWFGNLWQSFTALEWYIHVAVGAVLLIIIRLILKWINSRVRSVMIALKIMLVVAVIAAVAAYFISR